MRPLKQPHQKHLRQLNNRQLHTTKDTIISLPPTVTMKCISSNQNKFPIMLQEHRQVPASSQLKCFKHCLILSTKHLTLHTNI